MKGIILNSEGKPIAHIDYDDMSQGESTFIHKDNEIVAIVPKSFGFIKVEEQKEKLD